MAENRPDRKDENYELAILLGLGIIVLSTLAGWAWGGVISYTGSYAGGFVGFLIGLIIVMTVALARTR